MPDINLYRRHSEDCKGAKRGRLHTKCNCPVWCDGRVDGKRVHHSMKTKDWDRAERRMLSSFDPGAPAAHRKLLSDAIDEYLADCKVRNVKDSTITSYKNGLNALKTFCEANGAKYADEVTLAVLTAFRATRKGRDGETTMKPSTLRKELENHRAFSRFCLDREWMKVNAAEKMKAPRDTRMPTLPFTNEEITAILAACDQIKNNYEASAARARLRNRAFLLLMIYSGLRISDCALLRRDSVSKSGRLTLRTAKTGETVTLTLHQDAVDALKALPVESTEYFFWSGKGKWESCAGSLRRSGDAVFKLAGIKGHPHMFRDTFSVGLLNQGTSMRTVQLLLGHSSIQTTEKHYAPFDRGTQVILDAAVSKLDFGLGLAKKRVKNRVRDPKRNVISLSA